MLLKLPGNWAEVETGFPLVDEGTYLARVCKMTHEDGNVVSGDLIILDHSSFGGRHLFPRYDLTTDVGLRLFKEFVEAIGVEPDGNELNLGHCVGKTLEVTVKHHTHEDKTYANVARHQAAPRLETNE